MADYSFFMIAESDVTVTGTRTDLAGNPPTSLDGINQGDGTHLIGETITINTITQIEVLVNDDDMETNFADNDAGQRLDADVTVDGVTYATNTIVEAEYRFTLRDNTDPMNPVDYEVIAINFRTNVPGIPDFGTVEGLAFVDAVPPVGVALDVVNPQEGPGNTGASALDEGRLVICFAAGAMIETKEGARPVEHLLPGDRIVAADGQARRLRKCFSTRLDGKMLRENPLLYPVRICAGALGCGLPRRDLLVSRQHRMLVRSKIAQRMFGQPEVLIPAIKLTALPGIYVDCDVAGVTYYHLLFDRHEVIFAEGAPTESMFTGPEALRALSAEAREEVLTLFPELANAAEIRQPARLIPAGRMQKKMLSRHLRNRQPVLMSATNLNLGNAKRAPASRRP